jgi:hypothetical protein
MVGIKDNKVVYNTVDVILSSLHEIDQEALRISKILSI